MMTAAPLGALAEVILEQHGELIEAAISVAAERRSGLLIRGGASVPIQPTIERFGSDELALRYIQPGNWVTVGRVRDDSTSTLIEFNLTTLESREIPEPVSFQESYLPPTGDPSALGSPARQAAS